jgi:cell division transport system permease protein
MRALGYSFDEAVSSLWRRRGSTLLAVLTIGVAMFVLGVFLLLSLNVQRLVARWTETAELSVYLADGVSAEDKATVGSLVAAHGAVAGSEFVSSEEALKRFGRMFPEFAQAAAALGGQVLPASFEVRLKPGADGPPVTPLVDALRRMPGVTDVRYDREWVARLQAIVRTVRAAGAALALVLVLAAALTVASVVRLALHARRQEIEIMHLVGAPLTYIRGPFVMEGVLQGGLGALVALALLVLLYGTARVRLDAAAIAVPGLGAAAPSFLPALWIAALVAGGMAVGCIGGLVAARSAQGGTADR